MQVKSHSICFLNLLPDKSQTPISLTSISSCFPAEHVRHLFKRKTIHPNLQAALHSIIAKENQRRKSTRKCHRGEPRWVTEAIKLCSLAAKKKILVMIQTYSRTFIAWPGGRAQAQAPKKRARISPQICF
jgi:hypothetical protein